MDDPILLYSELSRKQRNDLHQDRRNYLQAQRKFTNILASGQWTSIHRDASVFAGDTVTSWEATEGHTWQFEKQSSTQLMAVNTYHSYAYPEDPETYSVEWIVQCDPIEKTFIARDPNVPDREAEGRYLPKTDTMQLLINGPAGPTVTPDNSPLSWGVTSIYLSHIT